MAEEIKPKYWQVLWAYKPALARWLHENDHRKASSIDVEDSRVRLRWARSVFPKNIPHAVMCELDRQIDTSDLAAVFTHPDYIGMLPESRPATHDDLRPGQEVLATSAFLYPDSKLQERMQLPAVVSHRQGYFVTLAYGDDKSKKIDIDEVISFNYLAIPIK